MGVKSSGATLEIQLVADVARLKSDMAAMQAAVSQATGGATQSFTKMATGTGVAATAMAAAAQSSAKAAVGMAAGVHAAGTAMQGTNIVAMEMFHVTRSITEQLAMGVNPARAFGMEIGRIATAVQYSGGSVRGLLAQFAAFTGVIKVTQNAELAEVAAQKATIAAAIQSRAERAAGAVVARQAQAAIAQAQVEAAVGADAEAAAQATLVKALRSVEVAAGQATVAQQALATAEAEATAAATEAKAASVVSIGSMGVALVALATVATGAFVAIRNMQSQINGTGELDRFRASLGLTHQEMLKLSDGTEKVSSGIKELVPVTATMGDVLHGFFDTLNSQVGSTSAWSKMKASAGDAASWVAKAWTTAAEYLSAGLLYAEDRAIAAWKAFPAAFADVFYQAVNYAISALNGLAKHGTDILNSFIAGVNKIPGVNVGAVAAPQIAQVANPYAGAAAKGAAGAAGAPSFAQELAKAKKGDADFTAAWHANTVKRIEDRMREQAAAEKANEHQKKARQAREKHPSDHGLQDALDKLDAEIKGQYALAAAYGVSAAAAQRAEADQKAAEDAIRHKGGLDQFKALELQKIVATDVAAQAKTNAGLQSELSIRAQLNGQLADGTLNVSQYNEALKNQTVLNKLSADLENADAAHKGQVRDIIKQTIDLQNEQISLAAQLNMLQQNASNDNEIQRLQLEASLIGKSNTERATAIAQLEAMQELQKIDPAGLLTGGERNNFIQKAVTKAQLGVQTPFQQWAASIPQSAAAINEALQQIKFKGLDSLTSAITDVITGTKSLSAAFSEVAKSIVSDILQMTIKMLIFRAISGMFGGGVPSLQATNPGGANYIPPFASANGNIFSGGNVIPFALGGVVNQPTMFPMRNGMGLMGEAGPEAVMPLTRDGQGRLGVRSLNDNQSGPIEITIGFGEAPAFAPYVQQVAGAAAGQAVQISVDHTNKTLRQIARPKLNG